MGNETSITKRLKCLCGNQLVKDPFNSSVACKNCSQWSDIGTALYFCFGRNCEARAAANQQYRVCCQCFENIPPSNQTLEQRLSFALQTTKSIIQQKTHAQEPSNAYLCNLKSTGGIYLTINSYIEHQLIPSALKDEFDGIYESALTHIEEAIV
eukprot:176496_1